MAAIVTAAPECCVALWDAVARGDDTTARLLHKRLLRLWNALDAPNLPSNVRVAMRHFGRNGGVARAPMSLSSPAQQERIGAAVDEFLSSSQEFSLEAKP